ncbi:MAG: diguanylate cyclase [Desulfuromonadales bacterium]|nr:diguanylate cyclase [Desulfuromonadales bacterium]
MENTRQKILIIDDTPANILIMHAVLGATYQTFFTTSGREGIKMARQELPDLILLDVMMPEMDGYEVCRELKAEPLTRRIPVIFITTMSDVEDEMKGLELGAIDYIIKPFSPSIVNARIKNHLDLKRYRDLLEKATNELDEKNQALNLLAREDALTGLANRRHFNEVLESEIKRAVRSRQLVALILCDVDFFKNYNDHYGHVAGDKCLQAIGQLFSGTFKRSGDLPARYGGEEFAVIIPDSPPGTALQLAEKLRQGMMTQALPHAFSAVAGVVTLSFGLVEAQPTRERNAEWYINRADQALYRAKESGRNRIEASSDNF